MKGCKGLREWLSPYLEGTLEESQKSQLREHLQGCPSCTQDLSSLKKLQAVLQSIGKAEAPKDLLANVRSRLASEPQGKLILAWPRTALSRTPLVLAASVGLVILGASLSLYLRSKPSKLEQTKSAESERKAKIEQQIKAKSLKHDLELASGSVQKYTPQGELTPEALMTAESHLSTTHPTEMVKVQQSFSHTPGEIAEELEQEIIHLEWTTPDLADATARLKAWLTQIQGSMLTSSEESLVLQLPISRYPELLDQLSKYGNLEEETKGQNRPHHEGPSKKVFVKIKLHSSPRE